MITPSFNNFFPPEVFAFVSDHTVDFALPKEGEPFNGFQKHFLLAQLREPAEKIVTILQVHGRRVLMATPRYLENGKISEADAAITDVAHLPLAVRTADCLSIFIFDPKQKAIGLVHAGWKGTKKKIVSNTIAMMKKKFSSQTKNLKVAFGPSIRSCCYQVGEEFKKYFPKEVSEKALGLYFDLPLANRNQLLALGVERKNILDMKFCTCCDQRFFSYRREGERTGRMISLIMLKG